MKRYYSCLLTLGLPVMMFLTQGCKIFLPAHPNSQAIKGEHVGINLITFEMAKTDTNYTRIVWDNHETKGLVVSSFVNLYTNAFKDTNFVPVALHNRPVKQGKMPPIFAALASAAIGYAVDFVKKQLDEEATLYQAQFDSNISDDAFWKKGSDSYMQNYCGFEVVRSVKGEKQAFRLLCGLKLSADGNFFRLSPLFQQTQKSKAKVLGDGWLTTLTPWVWIMKSPTHEVDTTADIEVDGFWVDKDFNSKFGKLAAVALKFNKLDLNSQKPFVITDDGSKTSGWMISVPPSRQTMPDDPASLGVFTLTVRVTEKDTSNTKQLLEQASKIVADNRASIISFGTNVVATYGNP